jgi:hypothetical protein
MLDRVSLAIMAEEDRPSVATGKIRCCKLPDPATGVKLSFSENTQMSIKASQKLGIDFPITAPVLQK